MEGKISRRISQDLRGDERLHVLEEGFRRVCDGSGTYGGKRCGELSRSDTENRVGPVLVSEGAVGLLNLVQEVFGGGLLDVHLVHLSGTQAGVPGILWEARTNQIV